MLRRCRIFLPLLTALALVAPPASGAGAVVTKGHFEYDLEDPAIGTVHFSCDEQRVEQGGSARETIHCRTTDTSHKSAVIFDPAHDFGGFPWFSDFVGEPASDFHLVGTPTGSLDGWATYA